MPMPNSGMAAPRKMQLHRFSLVQAGRDEHPDLVQPDRRGQDQPDDQCDLHPQVERVERAVQDKLVDPQRAAADLVPDMSRAQRALDDTPGLVEEDEPGGHPCGQGQRHRDDAVAQLTDVIHERHAAFGVLGILPPLGVHEALADDAGARDGTGELGHDRDPAVRQARLDGPPGRAGGLGGGCCGRRLRRAVHGGRTPQVTDLLLQRVDLRPLGPLLARGAGGDLGRCLDRCLSA
jgi:hypothetical protein